MLSLEYISLSLAGFIENIMSSMESTSVRDFIFDAMFATHPGTSDEGLGLEFSKGLSMSNKNKKKEPMQEIGDHVLTLIKALYQLCVYLATLFIVGGKFAFDALYEVAVKNPKESRNG